MYERVRTTLLKDCQLLKERTILVGVSGGPDSLCLLDILQREGYDLVIAHFDHALRPESANEAEAVLTLAGRLGLRVVNARADVAAHAESHNLSVEEAARNLRYEFLFTEAEELGAQAVAVGHNADDQVETVLMHLLRGAGLSGLRGMQVHSLPNAWNDRIPLVRPLLNVWREEIMQYLAGRDLPHVLDESNLDVRYYRNRLRHELIPYLEEYNPQVKRLIWRMANSLADDYEQVQDLVEVAWKDALVDSGRDYLGFAAEHTRIMKVGLVRHLFRKAIYHLRPDLRDIDYEVIERILEFLQNPPESGQIDLLAGLRLLEEGSTLWLADWQVELPHSQWPQLPHNACYYLPVPGMLKLPEGWILRAEPVTDRESALRIAADNQDPYRAWVDLSVTQLPIRVRTREAGDRIKPLGMDGHSSKVADLMVNVKLPARLRELWPILESDGEILWIPGVRVADPFRLRQDSERVAYLHLVKKT